MRGVLANTPHMVATLAETVHLHRALGAELLSPAAAEASTGAMIQHANAAI
ncbi:MAG TPA: hypothetical protein VFO16_23480 [Pseudonocardiaceae bacterium]|nr:hypothetical protein [Pseudonocardiaceae bacterium]